MIKAIAALDSRRGIANQQGVPWGRKLPEDIQQYHEKLRGATILMGNVMYSEMQNPLPECHNLVLTPGPAPLRPGFEKAEDLAKLLQQPPKNFWIVGGASVFEQALPAVSELHLTQLEGDFSCTKFFPDYKQEFELASESEPHTENDITYRFQVWKRKAS